MAEETREETPGESLPPIVGSMSSRSNGSDVARNGGGRGAYLRTLLILEAATQPFSPFIGRRFLPPAIVIQNSSQDVSDPGSCPETSPRRRFVGSLTSWLPVL